LITEHGPTCQATLLAPRWIAWQACRGVPRSAWRSVHRNRELTVDDRAEADLARLRAR